MKMAKQAIMGRIDPNVYKKIELFQKQNRISTKSQALDIILTDYFNSTENKARNGRYRKGESNCRMILCQLSDITAKMNEFEQNLKKEMIKK